MAAFDAALWDAQVANYNLIRLSSIIPPQSEIVIEKPVLKPGEFGDKLYVVYASEIQNEIGKEAWAGIGWVISKDGTGKGLFTEHEGHSEQEVINQINQTLESMVAYRPEEYSTVEYQTAGMTCEKGPVCAMVVAVYESESWSQ